MNRRKSCENCRGGITCRACGATLKPLPGQLSARDYLILLAVIDGTDGKSAVNVVGTVAMVLKAKKATARSALRRTRARLRELLEAAEGTPRRAAEHKQDAPGDAMAAREAIMRRAKAGEISFDEALKQLEAMT